MFKEKLGGSAVTLRWAQNAAPSQGKLLAVSPRGEIARHRDDGCAATSMLATGSASCDMRGRRRPLEHM